MKTTGREIIDVLEKAVELDWFRYSRAGIDEVETNAPIVVWRFDSTETAKETGARVIRAFRLVLDQFLGNVTWSLAFSGRNWVLAPKRVQELEDSGRFRTDGELLDYLRHEDPSFGKKSHEDLVAMARELAQYLGIPDQ